MLEYWVTGAALTHPSNIPLFHSSVRRPFLLRRFCPSTTKDRRAVGGGATCYLGHGIRNEAGRAILGRQTKIDRPTGPSGSLIHTTMGIDDRHSGASGDNLVSASAADAVGAAEAGGVRQRGRSRGGPRNGSRRSDLGQMGPRMRQVVFGDPDPNL